MQEQERVLRRLLRVSLPLIDKIPRKEIDYLVYCVSI